MPGHSSAGRVLPCQYAIRGGWGALPPSWFCCVSGSSLISMLCALRGTPSTSRPFCESTRLVGLQAPPGCLASPGSMGCQHQGGGRESRGAYPIAVHFPGEVNASTLPLPPSFTQQISSVNCPPTCPRDVAMNKIEIPSQNVRAAFNNRIAWCWSAKAGPPEGWVGGRGVCSSSPFRRHRSPHHLF